MTIFPAQTRKKKIQIRLITYYVAFALVTVTSMAYFAYAQAARSLRSTVEDKLTTVAKLKVDFLEQWVDQEQRNVVLFASLPELRQLSGVLLAPDSSAAARDHARTELTRLVTLIAQRTNEFQDVQILDPDGQIVISAFAPNIGRSQFGQPFFIEGQTRTFVQPFSKSELFERTTLIIATPLFDLNDRRVGVFALHLNMRHIDGIIQEDQSLNGAVQSYLVTPAHLIITEDPILLERLPEFNSVAVDLALAHQEGIASYINHAGVEVIGRYRWLEQQNAILVVEIEEAVALEPARRLALIIMIGGSVLSVLLVFVVTFLARRITAPLLALTETASSIANGELDALAPVLSNDEVGTLAQAFNSMTEKLRRTVVGMHAELRERQMAEQVLKRNEQEMRLTNELLRTIMDSPRGVIIFSLDREYRYTTFTQTHFETMRMIWGVTIETGMNMLECIQIPADREKARANFDRALQGEHFTLQEEYGDQALQRTWWENRYSPIFDETDQVIGLTVVVIDVTERKQMEYALQENEAKFRKVFHSSPVAICITVLEDGRLLEANYAYWDLTGYDPETSIGRNADELKMWDNPAERRKFVRDLRMKRSLFNPDDYFYHTDGSIRYVISFYELIQIGAETCVLAMFYDMSVQKKTVQALQQSEARTRALLEALPDMIMEVEASGVVISMVPPKGQETEMPEENFVGRPLQELLPDAIMPQMLEAVAGALDAEHLTVLEFEAEMASEQHAMEARVAPGTSASAIIIVRDITERKWMEAERERFIAELELRNKESETLRTSLAGIVETFNFFEIMRRILAQIQLVIPYDSASVWRVDGENMYIIYGVGLPPEIEVPGTFMKIDEHNSAMPILWGGAPYILNNNVQAELMDFAEPPHNFVESWLAIPLRTRGQVIGQIALDGKRKGQFTTHHAELAVTFANQVAIALENARLFSDLQDELKKQIALRNASMAISSSLHLDQVLEEICKQMCLILDGTSAYIAEYDHSYASYRVVAEYIANSADTAEQTSDLGVQYTRETGAVMFEPASEIDHLITYAEDENLSAWSRNMLTTYHGRTILHIPLYVQGRLLGHAELWDSRTRREFTPDEISFCRAVSQQAAIAIANANLFEQLQTELGERKNLIAELEAKNAELERFTYTVSHDLKSPLFTIRGFLGFLEQDALAGNQVRIKADIQRITDAAAKMHALLNDLLELSRIGRLKNESMVVPFDELAREAVELVHGRIMEQGIAIHIDAGLPSVFGDRQRLMEVVQNLVDNAAKFMGDQPAPRIEIGQQGMENGRPVFFVRDNGIGVAPEHYDRIFGLFNKLDVKSDGTGIGLALVKRIIEVHGGRIWVESRIGHGSTFFFTLPLMSDG